jgi:hypothetical protein
MNRMVSVSRCWISRRLFSKASKKGVSQEEAKEAVDYSEVMYGRRNRERADSLSTQMLQDRLVHKKRIAELPRPTSLMRDLSELGHGRKNRLKNIYASVEPTADSWMSRTAPRTSTGAGAIRELFSLTVSRRIGDSCRDSHQCPAAVQAHAPGDRLCRSLQLWKGLA